MTMKKTISKITSIAILSTSLITFIPSSSYGATYYSSNSYNSSNTNYYTSYSYANGSVTRYYSKNTNSTTDTDTSTNTNSSTKPNTETSNNQSASSSPNYTVSSSGSVTRYYSRNTESNNITDSSNTASDNTNNTPIDNDDSSSTVNDNVSFEVDELTKQMLTLINDERTKTGLKELILDERLTSVAKLKSKDMVENDYLSHTSATYGSIYTMIKNAGIKYYNAGENIARAFSVKSAHNNFMNSYMHKRAILADHFTHVGIGIEREKGGMYKISVMFIEEK